MSDPIELPRIDRIDYVGGSYPMKTRPGGEYVEYDDHVAIVRQLAEQRSELLDQLKVAAALLHGMPKSLGYDHDARGFDAVIARIANATQQRNATGGEG